jgi:phenylpyruvate tautomerase PptA (4-oxalocrotonate tautomerase family)
MWEGQSTQNKRAMAREITDVMAPFMNNKPDAIIVVFQEVPLDCYARGGELSVDRPDIQEKLTKGLPVSADGLPVSGDPDSA